ncbi:hypothetical protein MML48_3g00010078 [Holotrichia oblita]|uniref:Uncharacterized protein n=1 Tax=Holotrichia oblita TaxID=644536 RepID=A0ACB9TFI9_HOLOL|nr:hypothetical protein MML48_3g00010078 [Holotrichia oblita]
MSWNVVHFLKEDSVEAVPAIWLKSRCECFWPPHIGSKLTSSLQACEIPTDGWIIHSVRVIGSTYDNLKKARLRALRAETTSDINSDTGSKRNRRKKRLLYEDSDISDTETSEIGDEPEINMPLLTCQKENILKLHSKKQAEDQAEHTPTKLNVDNVIFEEGGSSNKTPGVSTRAMESMSDEVFKRQLFRQLALINCKIDTLLEDMASIKYSQKDTPNNDTLPHTNSLLNKFNLPLNTLQELKELEKFILTDANNYLELVNKLAKSGGANSKIMVKRIMPLLLSNELAMLYSWIGFKGKQNFSLLTISKVIIVEFVDLKRKAPLIPSRLFNELSSLSDQFREQKGCKLKFPVVEKNMVPNTIQTIVILLLSLSALNTEIIDRRQLKQGHMNNAPDTSVLKVTLTQKGYIQFLQYIADVPTISEFTFCIWMKSINLTHSHPLLSYSSKSVINKVKEVNKHSADVENPLREMLLNLVENNKVSISIYLPSAICLSRRDTERLIRSWVTPGGKNLNLEILENEIFSVPVELAENRWYHICQSWLSLTGGWIVFIDGQAKLIGFSEKVNYEKYFLCNMNVFLYEMRSVKIPSGGEIVVGQEYTDFDKGLDDGIEGDIYGFNLVLASASPTSVSEKQPPPLYLHQTDVGLRRQLHLPAPVLRSKRPLNIYRGSATQINSHAYDPNYNANLTPPKAAGPQITTEAADVPEVLSYFDTSVNAREAKGIFSNLGKGVLNMFNDYESEKPLRLKTSLAELTNSPTQHQVEQLNYGFYAPKHSSYVLQDGYNSRYSQQHQLYSPKRVFPANNRILYHQKVGLNTKPLGLILVELSYGNCALGKVHP